MKRCPDNQINASFIDRVNQELAAAAANSLPTKMTCKCKIVVCVLYISNLAGFFIGFCL